MGEIIMNRLYAGLIISVTIGVILALFPFYAPHLAPHIWSLEGNTEEEHGTTTIEGVIEDSNPSEGWILVSGHRITIMGTWTVETSNGTMSVKPEILIGEYLKPGTTVIVTGYEAGRWGFMAEEIEAPGLHAYKSESG